MEDQKVKCLTFHSIKMANVQLRNKKVLRDVKEGVEMDEIPEEQWTRSSCHSGCCWSVREMQGLEVSLDVSLSVARFR